MALTKEAIYEQLKNVIDPEVGLNIVDMGLVYDVDVSGDQVTADITLTTQGCPMGQYILGSAQQCIEDMEGVNAVQVNLVWDPPWSTEMINQDALAELRK